MKSRFVSLVYEYVPLDNVCYHVKSSYLERFVPWVVGVERRFAALVAVAVVAWERLDAVDIATHVNRDFCVICYNKPVEL
jgi:hypothetical protein